MHRILVALFCVFFVVGTNGASLKLATSIDENGIILAEMIEKLSSSNSLIDFNKRPYAICRFIDNCCDGGERLKTIPLFISAIKTNPGSMNFPEIINTCTGSTTLNKTYQTCPSAQQFSAIPEFQLDNRLNEEFSSIMNKYREELGKFWHYTFASCNDYELQAFLCLSNKKLLSSCTAKVLQQINDNDGYKAYHKFMKRTKEALTAMAEEVARLIAEDINTD